MPARASYVSAATHISRSISRGVNDAFIHSGCAHRYKSHRGFGDARCAQREHRRILVGLHLARQRCDRFRRGNGRCRQFPLARDALVSRYPLTAGSSEVLEPEHTHLGALEPIPPLQAAVSPSGQLTLHIWSLLSFVAVHSDCAETDCERVTEHSRAIKTSACLRLVLRISPSLGYELATFSFLIAKALNSRDKRGLRCILLFTRLVHCSLPRKWTSQAGNQAFLTNFFSAIAFRSRDRRVVKQLCQVTLSTPGRYGLTLGDRPCSVSEASFGRPTIC